MEYSQKRPIQVVLWTNVSRIEGTAHSLQSTGYSEDNRLSDLMNAENVTFLSISNARIYSAATDQLISEANFVSVNKRHIVMIAETQK